MEIGIKHPEHIVPSYSLTGDLLSYLRCKLQYRYYNGSSLPPSRPVQQWYGEFLHGTMELAYRYWSEHNIQQPLPWPCNPLDFFDDKTTLPSNDIGYIGNIVEKYLLQQGKKARSRNARNSAYTRVSNVINIIGKHLFPLIVSAEKKVIGTRELTNSEDNYRANNYEVSGIIDVLSNLTLESGDTSNPIKNFIKDNCKSQSGDYEIIVDYKGSERPNTSESYWKNQGWQICTYAWLRSLQADALPVVAGIIIYANELSPGEKEMINLKRGINDDITDIKPVSGSQDEQIVRMWRSGLGTDQLSEDFKFKRALRIIPITNDGIKEALSSFDQTVGNIEHDVYAETVSGDILEAWYPNGKDKDMCSACDFRYMCPQPAGKPKNYPIKVPPPATTDEV